MQESTCTMTMSKAHRHSARHDLHLLHVSQQRQRDLPHRVVGTGADGRVVEDHLVRC